MYYLNMEANLILNGTVDEKYYWPILYTLNIVENVCNVLNTVPKRFTLVPLAAYILYQAYINPIAPLGFFNSQVVIYNEIYVGMEPYLTCEFEIYTRYAM